MNSNTELLRHHVSLVARPTQPGDREIYGEDVVMTLMYAPEGHTNTLKGPDAILRFMARIAEFFDITSRPTPQIVETAKGALAEYRGDMVCKETNSVYIQDYVAIAEITDGKIIAVREYYDPIRVLKAFGEL